MPWYENRCDACGYVLEEVRSVSAPQPEHCGQPMPYVIGRTLSGHNTLGGNLILDMSNRIPKGNRKPKTIGRGRGLGGRRAPPSVAKALGQKLAAHGIQVVPDKKEPKR